MSPHIPDDDEQNAGDRAAKVALAEVRAFVARENRFGVESAVAAELQKGREQAEGDQPAGEGQPGDSLHVHRAAPCHFFFFSQASVTLPTCAICPALHLSGVSVSLCQWA